MDSPGPWSRGVGKILTTMETTKDKTILPNESSELNNLTKSKMNQNETPKHTPACLCAVKPPFEIHSSFYVNKERHFCVLHLNVTFDVEARSRLERSGGMHCHVHKKKSWWGKIIVPSQHYIDMLADLWTAAPCGAEPFFSRYLSNGEWNLDQMLSDDERFYPSIIEERLTFHGQFNFDGTEKQERMSNKSRKQDVSREDRMRRIANKDSALGKEKKIQLANEQRQRRQKAAEKQMFDALSFHGKKEENGFWSFVKELLTSFSSVIEASLPIATIYSCIRVIFDVSSLYEAKFLAVQSLLTACEINAKPLEFLTLIAFVFTATKFQRMYHVDGMTSLLTRGTTPTVALITLAFMFLFKRRPNESVIDAFVRLMPELPRSANGLDWIVQSSSNVFKAMTEHVNPALNISGRVKKVADFIESCRGRDAHESLMMSESRQEEAFETLKETTELIKIIPYQTNEGVHLRTLHSELTRICTTILSSPISGAIYRKEPVILHLVGDPGLGKTMMITGFIIEGLRHLYTLEGRSDEYMREMLPKYSQTAHYSQLAAKYETNFNSKEHRILVCDDANQINAQYATQDVIPFPLKTIQWKNNAPHLMPVAEVENKRLARFQCELIIATDNTKAVWLDYLMDPKAYVRRLDIQATVKLKPGYTKKENNVDVIDPSKLDPNKFDTSAYIFKIDGDEREYTFFDISAMLKIKLKEQRDRFYRNTSNFVDFALRDLMPRESRAEVAENVQEATALGKVGNYLKNYFTQDPVITGQVDDLPLEKSQVQNTAELVTQLMEPRLENEQDSEISEQSLSLDEKDTIARIRAGPSVPRDPIQKCVRLFAESKDRLTAEGPWHDSPFEPMSRELYDWLNDWVIEHWKDPIRKTFAEMFLFYFKWSWGLLSVFAFCFFGLRWFNFRERLRGAALEGALKAVKDKAFGSKQRRIVTGISITAGIFAAIWMWKKTVKSGKRVVITPTEEPPGVYKYEKPDARAPKAKPRGKPKDTKPVMLSAGAAAVIRSEILDPIGVSMRQAYQYNMYSIRAKSAHHVGELRGIFVCGRMFLVNKHLFDDFRTDEYTLELMNPWAKIAPIPNSKFKVTFLASTDEDGANIEPWDFAIVDFGTSVNDHRNILSHFIKDEDVAGLKGQEIQLVSLNCIENIKPVNTWESLIQRTSITRVCDDYTQVMSSDSTWKYLWGMIEYECQSFPGYCGSIIQLNDPKRTRKLVGLHAAGYHRTDEGSGVYVTQEQLLKMISNFKIQHKLSIPIDKILEGEMNTVIKGFTPVTLIPDQIRCPTKSNIHKGLLHAQLLEPTKFPAALGYVHVDGKKEHVMNLAMQKYKGTNVLLDELEEDVIYAHLCVNFKVNRPVSEISHEVSIKGIDGNRYIGPINVRSSAGYPLGKETESGKVGKSTFVGSEGEWIFDHPSLMREINAIIASIENNERPMVFFTVTPKDEVQKPGKLTRQFAAAPLAFVLLYRRYFLDVQANIMENKIKNGSLVGINPMSEDWDNIVRDMQRIAPIASANFLDGDFANFDGDLNSYILWVIYRYFETQYQRNDSITTFALWNEIVHSHQVFGNTVVSVTKGQPSGSPATTILNSLYNASILKLVMSNILRRQKNYEIVGNLDAHFKSYVYGDDNIMVFSNALKEVLDPLQITHEMSRLGHKFTSSDKDERGLKYRSLSEISILKRHFVYDGKTRTWLAPLELTSIFSSLNWDKVDPRFRNQKRQQTADNILGAIRELSQHPKAVFQEYVPRMLELAREHEIPLNELCFFSQDSIRLVVREIEQNGMHINAGSPDWQPQSIDPNAKASHFYPGVSCFE